MNDVHRNSKYYVAFSHCAGIGPVRFKALLKHFPDAKAMYEASSEKLISILNHKVIYEFDRFRREYDVDKKMKEIGDKGIDTISLCDSDYPQDLLNIEDPPICLYVRGDRKSLGFSSILSLGIVGTRSPTSYGIQVTKHIVGELCRQHVCIVSGMALGIDAVAHWSAINAGAPTVAVLGCGVDIVYPETNSRLYKEIIKAGAVISEFPPSHTVLKGLFVARNRIISGLTKGVVVIEGSGQSGALITARYAADQGRQVFAVPSPITSPMGEAPNALLKNGASFVTGADDILNEFGIRFVKKGIDTMSDLIGAEERVIVNYLLKEPYSVDALVQETKQPIQLLLQKLSQLELFGCIEKNNEGKYQLKLMKS